MNEEQAQDRVNNIAAQTQDDEIAHVLEDDLRRDFIEYVAKRDDELGRVARIVMSTEKLNFARWCA